MRNRNQASAAPPAELHDPAVVSARIRLREIRVSAFDFIKQAERWIQESRHQPFRVDSLDPLLRIHRTERCARYVSPLWTRQRLFDGQPHSAQTSGHPVAHDF